MQHLLRLGLLVCGLLLALTARPHAEHERGRYVAPDGRDEGRCDRLFRPCRTLQYAASQAGKGDRVLVAEGRYEIRDPADLYYLTSGLVEVYGGFSRLENYARQVPDEYPTVLVGVPLEFRDALTARGFDVIVDSKGLDAEAAAQSARLMAGIEALTVSSGQIDCVGGMSGGFACDKIGLHAHLALGDFRSRPSRANDVWGFVDLNTEREYAIIGLANATSVVDVSDPTAPVEIGFVTGQSSIWRDIKVYQLHDAGARRWRAYAYVTTDASSDRLTVIDLTGLPNAVALAGRETTELSAHNVYISGVDYASGIALDGLSPRLHTAGSNLGFGQFRSYSLADPARPLETASGSGGYMHDGTSLLIDDGRAFVCSGEPVCEVLVDFNESTVELWDIGESGVHLSSTGYTNASYVHSGWWSEDKRFIYVHDEQDEQNVGLNTTLRVFNIDNLVGPVHVGTWTGPTRATDHNGYVRGNRYYMSNYTRGLTVLDISNPAAPVAVGRFDSFPMNDAPGFSGAWGAYPFLPSGTILVSDINSGLYVLEDQTLDVPAGSFRFSSRVAGGSAGGVATLEVQRSGSAVGAVSVGYETLSASADLSDYVAQRGVLSWVDGDGAPQNIVVALSADVGAEPLERLFVRLFDPRGGATLSSPREASVFIATPGAASTVEFAG